jgi:flavin reductase (DIM6/NTAB) family NADH-FMN oxidoreductase RutF
MTNPLGEALRGAMRRWASGVTVVTAAHGGRRAGMTVSAFFSASLEPPAVVVSLHAGVETLALLRESGTFAVSVLAEGQDAASGRFAGYGLPPGADRFEGSPVSPRTTGAPVLDDAIAWIDCRVAALHPAGTHVLVVGEVVAAGSPGEGARPLVYYDRAYRRLAT